VHVWNPTRKGKKKILKIQNPNFLFGKKKKIWFAKKKKKNCLPKRDFDKKQGEEMGSQMDLLRDSVK
jgi:hypothetical protein